MWCKKCWPFLEAAKQNKYTAANSEKVKDYHCGLPDCHIKPMREYEDKEFSDYNYNDFQDFRLLPHEFLLLACNSYSRPKNLHNIFKPDFKAKKLESRKLVTYELTEKDL